MPNNAAYDTRTTNPANRLAQAVGLNVAAMAAAVQPAGLLFQDSFEAGDTTKHNDYFRWSKSGDINTAGAGSSRIDSVVGPDGVNSVNAYRFAFGRWIELGFTLTSSIDEVRSAELDSDTTYPEAWMSYDVFVPANYTHQRFDNGAIDEGTSREVQGGANNKVIYLWNGSYEGRDNGTGSAIGIQSFPSDFTTEVFGKSSQSTFHGGYHGHTQTYVHPDYRLGPRKSGYEYLGPNDIANLFLDSQLGTWVNLKLGMKAESAIGAADGWFSRYNNGVLAAHQENITTLWGLSKTNNKLGFDRGYIWGYANSGFQETTTLYLTNFKFGTTDEGVS